MRVLTLKFLGSLERSVLTNKWVGPIVFGRLSWALIIIESAFLELMIETLIWRVWIFSHKTFLRIVGILRLRVGKQKGFAISLFIPCRIEAKQGFQVKLILLRYWRLLVAWRRLFNHFLVESQLHSQSDNALEWPRVVARMHDWVVDAWLISKETILKSGGKRSEGLTCNLCKRLLGLILLFLNIFINLLLNRRADKLRSRHWILRRFHFFNDWDITLDQRLSLLFNLTYLLFLVSFFSLRIRLIEFHFSFVIEICG